MRTIILLSLVVMLTGCMTSTGNVGRVQSYPIPQFEAEWIRNGEPIEYQGELWYPYDGIEILLDTEVYQIGEHKGVQFFVEKTDVKPYERLYTKFDRDKYRFYVKK